METMQFEFTLDLNVMISCKFQLVVRKWGYRKTAMRSDSPEFEFEIVKCHENALNFSVTQSVL